MNPPLTAAEIDAAFAGGAVGCCVGCSGPVVHNDKRRDFWTPGEHGDVYIGSAHERCTMTFWERTQAWIKGWLSW